MTTNSQLTHVAGTFVIQADGSFLNGAGLGQQGEDRNVTLPKTLLDGRNKVPYVSAQAWKRWLRNTTVAEAGWPASELRAIKLSERNTTSKISGELDPISFPEDDIFGYMRTQAAATQEAEATEGEEAEGESEEAVAETPSTQGTKAKPVVRASPFAASLLLSIRKSGWRGVDEGFVHLNEGTPLPYKTQFYTANMQAVFCLDYGRLGVFWNVGDRIELADEFVQPYLDGKKIEVKQDLGKKGKIYAMTNTEARKQRAGELLNALSVLRGGAKQAQFGTDVSPKVIIAAGLTCGNPIFNHLFDDGEAGLCLKVNVLKQVIQDYADRIVTPVYVGVRTGLLANEQEVCALNEQKIGRTFKNAEGKDELKEVEIIVCTPREAAEKLAEQLP
jgi:CRISPR-associated protein Cst2